MDSRGNVRGWQRECQGKREAFRGIKRDVDRTLKGSLKSFRKASKWISEGSQRILAGKGSQKQFDIVHLRWSLEYVLGPALTFVFQHRRCDRLCDASLVGAQPGFNICSLYTYYQVLPWIRLAFCRMKTWEFPDLARLSAATHLAANSHTRPWPAASVIALAAVKGVIYGLGFRV